MINLAKLYMFYIKYSKEKFEFLFKLFLINYKK